MMIPFEKFKKPKSNTYKYRGKSYDDNIYTFDIETISLFEIDGEFKPFDYNLPAEYYTKHDKVSCCYIWMFGCNDKVYYGRDLQDFGKILEAIGGTSKRVYLYIHNLSYEMQWLFNIFVAYNWHISNICARQVRKPIDFIIEELNIEFRCSYMLTNLSLEKSAEKYTDVKKAVGDLDYNVAYSPLSKLPEKALYYCEMDIITLYKIILYFRTKYKHIKSIPLTQTGEVRYSFRKEVGYWYIKEQQQKVPPAYIYELLMIAFAGGITHGNILYLNMIMEDCWSFDFCSSYPWTLVSEDFPTTPFRKINIKQVEKMKDTHCILYRVKLSNIRSKLYNHYIAFYKMINVIGDPVIDNGRLSSLNGSCEMVITDIDLEMIELSYTFDIEYIDIFASRKAKLDPKVIMFILQRYKDKTTLKGIEEQQDYYMKMKQELNSIFGMSCTNPLKTGINVDNEGNWSSEDYNHEFVIKKLEDMKKSYSTLFFPMAVGCWCTAYARRNLWKYGVVPLDHDVIYYDTDSVKGKGDKVYSVVEKYNNMVLQKIDEIAKEYNIDISYFKPKDNKGVEHPIGVFEDETATGRMQKLKTLGAKKYFYVDHEGKNHITVSGVSKGASRYMDIDDFKVGYKLSYEATNSLIHFYNNEQQPFGYTDIDGNYYRCNQKFSIILQPTNYTLGVTDKLMQYILLMQGYVDEF